VEHTISREPRSEAITLIHRQLQSIGSMAAWLAGGVDVLAISRRIEMHDEDLREALLEVLAWSSPIELVRIQSAEERLITCHGRREARLNCGDQLRAEGSWAPAPSCPFSSSSGPTGRCEPLRRSAIPSGLIQSINPVLVWAAAAPSPAVS
jgi:hypothetical protein